MTKISTREEIIRKGAELIHAQGFNATGLQQILQVAGIPQGSFYFYFKSKEDFGLEVIDYFDAMISGILTHYLSDKKYRLFSEWRSYLNFSKPLFRKTVMLWGVPSGTFHWSWPELMNVCVFI